MLPFEGPGDLFAKASASGALDHFTDGFEVDTWLAMTVLSLLAIILLPRQFHVAVVENNSDVEIRRAAWLFPLYLVLINLFVVPIAVAGVVTFGSSVDADTFVIALPMALGDPAITLAAFIGGLSAATAMVIVACVALSIMISNNIVVPLILRHRVQAIENVSDPGYRVLAIRRGAIVAVMLLAYAYYRLAGGTAALASIGLLSFAAMAQFAPAFFGGLVWRGANARGAVAGLSVGFVVWAYTLLLPAFVESGLLPTSLLEDRSLWPRITTTSVPLWRDHDAACSWRLLESLIKRGRFRLGVFDAKGRTDRTTSGQRIRAAGIRAGAGFSDVAHHRDGWRSDADGGAVCRQRSSRARLWRVRRTAASAGRTEPARRRSHLALHRATADLSDRSVVIAHCLVSVNEAPGSGGKERLRASR